MPNKLQGHHGSTHRNGYEMGNFNKKTSQGNGHLTRSGRLKKKNSNRGQGK